MGKIDGLTPDLVTARIDELKLESQIKATESETIAALTAKAKLFSELQIYC